MLFLLYKHADDGIFDAFPKISDNFPKISENSSKLVHRSHEHCQTFFENFRRLLQTFEEDPKMSRSLTPTNLSTI